MIILIIATERLLDNYIKHLFVKSILLTLTHKRKHIKHINNFFFDHVI